MLLYVCCCRCWLTFPCGRSYIYRSLCSGDTSLVWREVAAHTVSRAEKTSRDSRESFLSADSARDESLSFFHSAPEHISHMCLRSTLDAGGLKAAPPPRTTYAPWGMLRLRPASVHESPNLRPYRAVVAGFLPRLLQGGHCGQTRHSLISGTCYLRLSNSFV